MFFTASSDCIGQKYVFANPQGDAEPDPSRPTGGTAIVRALASRLCFSPIAAPTVLAMPAVDVLHERDPRLL
ncbi:MULTISPECIES: hypothetical protein [unclassified Caballeronia]|uniref:hypothetical protein n=1 Tax=unclassified Caballeronia TaxID=2646786 RepID=UPI0028567C14|nr:MULTISPECIES: hypothetical protein [unclassified Caballeronia]MDR5750685.1 hypothetical protein [Caballeronia sp. LZ024]MDR5842283.1 hypothetical protein [Caballeronia sp. LZ031]